MSNVQLRHDITRLVVESHVVWLLPFEVAEVLDEQKFVWLFLERKLFDDSLSLSVYDA